MSVDIMSLVFKAKIENVKLSDKNVTAPLLKLVMLALADHCNDDGDGAYPSLTTLEKKTALTRKSVLNSLEALKQQGFIIRAGISRRGTTNYSLNVPMLRSLTYKTETPLFASEPGTLPKISSSEPGTQTSEPGSVASEPGIPEPSLIFNNHTKNISLTDIPYSDKWQMVINQLKMEVSEKGHLWKNVISQVFFESYSPERKEIYLMTETEKIAEEFGNRVSCTAAKLFSAITGKSGLNIIIHFISDSSAKSTEIYKELLAHPMLELKQ